MPVRVRRIAPALWTNRAVNARGSGPFELVVPGLNDGPGELLRFDRQPVPDVGKTAEIVIVEPVEEEPVEVAVLPAPGLAQQGAPLPGQGHLETAAVDG
jgi:hypothetical protein